MLAINVSGINEEEAGALNGHDVPVKNDYTRHTGVLYKDRCQCGDAIDVLLAYGRGGKIRSFRFVRGSHVLSARDTIISIRESSSRRKKKKKKRDYPIFRNVNELIDARISSRGIQEIVPRVLRPGTRCLPRKPLGT